MWEKYQRERAEKRATKRREKRSEAKASAAAGKSGTGSDGASSSREGSLQPTGSGLEVERYVISCDVCHLNTSILIGAGVFDSDCVSVPFR